MAAALFELGNLFVLHRERSRTLYHHARFVI